MNSSISVAPVAIILVGLTGGIIVGLASHKLTWTEIILGATFGLIIGSLAGPGLADGLNAAVSNVVHASGH
jgi:hypothetical protein